MDNGWELEEDYTIETEPIMEQDTFEVVSSPDTTIASTDEWEIESAYTPTPITKKTEETPIMDFLTKPNDAPKAEEIKTARTDLDKQVKEEGHSSLWEKASTALFGKDDSVDLKEAFFMFQDKKFETDNIRNYTSDQLKKGVKKVDIYKNMEKAGATVLDIQEASQVMRGITPGSEVGKENISEPAARGAKQIVTGIGQVAVDITNAVGVETPDAQAYLDENRAEIKAGEDKYIDTYGENGAGGMIQGAVKHAPEVAMMAFNPSSPIITALGEAGFQYTVARGEGFDPAQAGTQAALIGSITGGMTKLANNMADVPTEIKGNTAEAISSMGQEKAYNILEAIDFAKKNNIEILGSDVDPGTQLSQLIESAKTNPVVSGKLKDVTEKDVEAITTYLSEVKNNYSKNTATNESTGEAISAIIGKQEANYDEAISKAYDDLGNTMGAVNADISNKGIINWLEAKKADFTTSKKISSTDRDEVLKTIDGYIKDYQRSGNNVNVQDLYRMVQDSIAKTADFNKQAGGGSSARANQMMTELFEGQFDSLAKQAGEGNEAVAQVMNQAKQVYKDRVAKFGYRGTGKGYKGNGTVAKFRDEYIKDPEGAMKKINTPEKLREVKEVLGEDSEVVGMMQRNYLENSTQVDGINTDLRKAGSSLTKDDAYIRELFGDDYRDIKNLGEVLKILGKRQDNLSRSASLIGNSIINDSTNSLGQIAKNLTKFLKGKYTGKGMVGLDKRAKASIEAEMKAKLGMSPDEFADQLANSKVMPASVQPAKSVDDIYQSPEGLPTKQEADEVQAGLNETQAETNLAEAGTKAEQEALQGIDKQLQRQQTNLNKEISAGFRTRTLGPDDRLEYNRIQEEIVASRNSGDRESVQQGMDKLSTFREHIKSLPKRENSTEEANRIAIEQANAARQRRQVAAQEKLARQQREAREAEELAAQQAAEAEASEANRLELRRQARINRRVREQEAEAERARLEAQRNIPTTAEQRQNTAYGNLVDNLNKNLGDGWTVDGGAHPNFRNRGTGEYFSLHIYGDRIGATTTGLQNGSGAGSKVYHGIFDLAEELGGVYKPSSTLLTANPVRTGMNMITYSAKRGEDTPWIEIGEAQKGIGRRGTDGYLGGKRLTRENANKLAKNLRAMVTRLTPKSLTRQTTDEGLQRIAETTGTNSRVRLGYNSLKTLRDFMRRGAAPGAMAGMLGVLMMDDDIMNGLEQAAQGEM